MKNILLLMVLALGFAVSCQQANAQVKMYKSSNGYTVGTSLIDTVTAGNTSYMITPVGALNASSSGRYRIAVNYTAYNGVWTGRFIVQGRVQGSSSTDSAWVNLNQVRGTDGVNCDTLAVTSSVPARGWIFNVAPGSAHVEQTGATTTAQNVYWTAAGRVTQIRVVVTSTTNPVRIHDCAVLMAN